MKKRYRFYIEYRDVKSTKLTREVFKELNSKKQADIFLQGFETMARLSGQYFQIDSVGWELFEEQMDLI